MQTCLVTGGAGFIGSHLAEALIDRDQRVLVVLLYHGLVMATVILVTITQIV